MIKIEEINIGDLVKVENSQQWHKVTKIITDEFGQGGVCTNLEFGEIDFFNVEKLTNLLKIKIGEYNPELSLAECSSLFKIDPSVIIDLCKKKVIAEIWSKKRVFNWALVSDIAKHLKVELKDLDQEYLKKVGLAK